MLGPLLFRLVVTLTVTAAAGGTQVWRHPALLVFLALEAAWSLVEGYLSRGGRAIATSWQSLNPQQIPFVLSGKWLLLARMGYHIVLLGYFGLIGSSTASLAALSAIAGTTLMLVAIGLRAWSMQTLGERFRGYEVRAEPRGLETGGPYALVRHPSYFAIVLFDLGMPLLLNAAWLLTLLVVQLAVLLRRVSAEERLLLTAYPVDYPVYVARTRRIVPKIY
jgi:protein-S-isoprenylcysteine O-methyltransferase Ste14